MPVFFAYLLAVLASASAVAGQLHYKRAATERQRSVRSMAWIRRLALASLLFFAALACNYFALKVAPLYVIFCFTALNYVFVVIFARLTLREPIRMQNIVASVLIAAGVLLATVGA